MTDQFELPSGLPEGPWDWCIHDHSLATLHDKRGPDWGHLLSIGPCDSCAKSAGDEWKWGRCRTPSEDVARAIASIPAMVEEIGRLREANSELGRAIREWRCEECERLRALNAEMREAADAVISPYRNLTDEALTDGVLMEHGPPKPEKGRALMKLRAILAKSEPAS